MVGRDFDAEFARIISIDAAANDSSLRYFYWDRVHKNSPPLPGEQEEIRDVVRYTYDLDEQQFRMALVMCIAGIIDGVKTGREICSGKA